MFHICLSHKEQLAFSQFRMVHDNAGRNALDSQSTAHGRAVEISQDGRPDKKWDDRGARMPRTPIV